MASDAEHLRPQLYQYTVAHSTGPDPLLRELADETVRRFPEVSRFQIGHEQGVFMTMLANLVGVRRAVEVGTFTGYSSICLARGLADGGLLTCCDISEEWTSVARDYWRRAGVADRVELRLGPAVDTLRAFPPGASFDLAFIDADKASYTDYWDEVIPRMRPGGVVLVDNVFFHGEVLADDPNPDGKAIQEFNDHAAADPRVDLVMLPVGDGLTMARTK